MEMIQTSVVCRLLTVAWAAVYTVVRESVIGGALMGFFDEVLARWARGSAFCRWLAKDGFMGAAWTGSLFGRLVTWLANLVPSLLHRIYRWQQGLFDGSLLCRFGYAVGDQTAVLSSWVVLAILVIPHDLWNNLYGLGMSVCLLLAFYWAGMRKPSWRIETGILGGAFWIYALTVAMAVLISASKSESLRYFLFHLMALLLAGMIVSSVTKREELIRITAFAAAGVAISSLYGFWQRAQGIDVDTSTVDLVVNADTPGRVDSFFSNPNTFAQILALLIPLCCGLVLSSRSVWGKLLAGGTVLLGGAATLLTYSRAGWLGLAMAVFLFFFLVNRKSVLVLLLAAVAAMPFLPESIWNRVLTIFGSSDTSIASRFPIYQAGLRVFHDHCFIGVGLGNEVSTAVLEGTSYYDFGRGFRFVHYHNVFLQLMVERGLLGLLAFLGTLFWGCKEGLMRTVGCRDLRYLTCGAIAGLFGMLVCGMGDYIWYYPRAMMLFWFVFAILLSAVRLASGRKQEEENP